MACTYALYERFACRRQVKSNTCIVFERLEIIAFPFFLLRCPGNISNINITAVSLYKCESEKNIYTYGKNTKKKKSYMIMYN